MNVRQLATNIVLSSCVLGTVLLTACQVKEAQDRGTIKTACHGSTAEKIWIDRQIGVTLPTDHHHIYQRELPNQDINHFELFCDAPEGRYLVTYFLRDRVPSVSALMAKLETQFRSQGYKRVNASNDPMALEGEQAKIRIYGSSTPGWNAVVVLKIPNRVDSERFTVRFSATLVR